MNVNVPMKSILKFSLRVLNIDILVILDGLRGRGSRSEHLDQLLGVNNALKETKIRM